MMSAKYRSFQWLFVLLLHGQSIFANNFTSENFPNPRIDWLSCGQSLPGNLCDPDNFIPELDRNRAREILSETQVALRGKAVCEGRAADPTLYAVFIKDYPAQHTDTKAQANNNTFVEQLRHKYVQDTISQDCDLFMLLLFVTERLHIAFSFNSTDINIAKSRSRSALDNSPSMLVNLADVSSVLVLLAECTSVVNMLLQPLHNQYWLIPNPRLDPRNCRQPRSSYLCDSEGVLTPEQRSKITEQLHSLQAQIYTRNECADNSQTEEHRGLTEFFVVFLPALPQSAAAHSAQAFTNAIWEMYSFRNSSDNQLVCLTTLVAAIFTDNRTFSVSFPASSGIKLSSLNATMEVRSAILNREMSEAVFVLGESLTEAGRVLKSEDDGIRERRSAEATVATTVWIVLCSVILLMLIVTTVAVFYCCFVRDAHSELIF